MCRQQEVALPGFSTTPRRPDSLSLSLTSHTTTTYFDSRLTLRFFHVLNTKVGKALLAGELDYRRGRFSSAFDHLRRAVALEAALPYDEPAGWVRLARLETGEWRVETGCLRTAAVLCHCRKRSG
jgi:hypothetical protein